jgi:hypothetical protein
LAGTRAVIDLDMIGAMRRTFHRARDRAMNALFRYDHFPFLVHHVPAVWFFGGWHPGYHEPSDTVDKLNFLKIEKVMRLAARSAAALANATDTPRFQSNATY